MNSIRKKVQSKSADNSITSIIYVQNRYNLEKLLQDHPECKKEISSEGKDKRFRNNAFEKVSLFTDAKTNEDDIKVLGLIKNKRYYKYLPRPYFDLNHENIEKWKVLIPAANGTGVFGEVFSTPVVVEPFVGYTQTFIGIGAFETEVEANAALKYIKTKFCRTMLGVLKITQTNSRDTWAYVPLQDFTSSSNIDWSKSVAEIDEQLYRKYGLSDEEIEFIETHVKEMN